MKILSEELANAQAERRALMLEMETNLQNSSERMETLLHRVTSLTEERDQLQEILNAFREEKKLLRTELEERMETVKTCIDSCEHSFKKLKIRMSFFFSFFF